MSQRDSYHHGDLKTVLVTAGLAQLEAGGVDSVSLRALAKTAGVSPNAPYRHFEDKRELMATLAAKGFQIFADGLERSLTPHSPREQLKAIGLAYGAFAAKHPALYRLMFSPMGYSLNSAECKKEAERAFGFLISTVAQAQSTGWKGQRDLNTASQSFWALLHGWAGLVGEKLIPPEVPATTLDLVLETFLG